MQFDDPNGYLDSRLALRLTEISRKYLGVNIATGTRFMCQHSWQPKNDHGCCPNVVQEFSRHTDMADLNEGNASEQETPALTEAISAILAEVK